MLKWITLYGANNIVQFSCTFKTKVFAEEDSSECSFKECSFVKCLLEKPTYGDIVEAKEIENTR